MVMAGEKMKCPSPSALQKQGEDATAAGLARSRAGRERPGGHSGSVLTSGSDTCPRSAAKTTPRASFLSKHFSSVRLRSSGNLQLVPDDAPPPTPTKTA